MELQNFVSQTITQILAGIATAQKEAVKYRASINPSYVAMGKGKAVVAPSFDHKLQLLEFDIAVQVTQSDKTGVEGKIGMALVSGVGDRERQHESSATSRIKFNIYYCPPVQETMPEGFQG